MRWFLGLLGVVVVAATACGGGDVDDRGDVASSTSEASTPSSTTTTSPASTTSAPVNTTVPPSSPPADDGAGEEPTRRPLPDLLVAHGTQVDFVETTIARDVKVTPLLTTRHPVIGLRQSSDGSIFTQEVRVNDEGTEVHEVRRYVDGRARVVADAQQLFDVAVVEGVESVIVGVVSDDEVGAGGITALSIADPSVVVAEFGPAVEAGFSAVNADFAGGLLVVSASGEPGGSIVFVRPNGERVDLPSPTDDVANGGPRLVVAATFSVDGTGLFWAETPDTGPAEESGTEEEEEGEGRAEGDDREDGEVDDEIGPIPAQWVLRGADLSTGEERLYRPVGGELLDASDSSVDSLHDFGTHLLANRSRSTGSEPGYLEPWIVDFTAGEPEDWALPLPGVAVPAVVAP